MPEAMREPVPTADDPQPEAQYIQDDTLLPYWPRDGHKELYAGKHKTTEMNVHDGCTIYGKNAWSSDPVPNAATTTTTARNNPPYNLR